MRFQLGGEGVLPPVTPVNVFLEQSVRKKGPLFLDSKNQLAAVGLVVVGPVVGLTYKLLVFLLG